MTVSRAAAKFPGIAPHQPRREPDPVGLGFMGRVLLAGTTCVSPLA